MEFIIHFKLSQDLEKVDNKRKTGLFTPYYAPMTIKKKREMSKR